MLALVSPKGCGKIEEEIKKTQKQHCWLWTEQQNLCWDLGVRPFRPWKEEEVSDYRAKIFFGKYWGYSEGSGHPWGEGNDLEVQAAARCSEQWF